MLWCRAALIGAAVWVTAPGETARVSAQTPAKTACAVRSTPMSPGDIAMARKEFAKAVDAYAAESKAAGAEGERTRNAMVRALLSTNKVAEAEASATAWLTESPQSVWAKTSLAEVQVREGRIPEAFASAQSAMAADACNARARLELSEIFSLNAMYATAKSLADVAHTLDPVDDEIFNRWIARLPRQAKIVEAEKYQARASYLTENQKKDLERWRNSLKTPSTDTCALKTPVASTKIPYRALQDGPYEPVFWGLEVELNGKMRRLEIDTGASGFLLTADAAAALRLTPVGRGSVGGFGDEGAAKAYSAKVDSIRIGGLEFENCAVGVLSTKPAVMRSDGLIGGDVFEDFLLTLDFPGRELRIDPLPARQQGAGEAASLSLATDGASGEDSHLDRIIDPSMKDWVKVFRVYHDMILPVRVNGGSSRLFIVDSGAAGNLISPEAAKEVARISSDPATRLYGLSGEVKKVDRTGPLTLVFGGLSQHADGMTAIDLSSTSKNLGVEISGFLGQPTLHQLTIHIDYRDNLMKFDFDPKRLQHCDEGIRMPGCY